MGSWCPGVIMGGVLLLEFQLQTVNPAYFRLWMVSAMVLLARWRPALGQGEPVLVLPGWFLLSC